ncbi:Helix-hairpin-helix motif-containing protein [Chryseolinea serpens]|uniref:Helix-hairpin-helix motif-containing protein n=1 Tax=Chryseolinea serpens TaxID=947013 RepID=A0A1M5MFB2_9BACT|nr:helix-hairpin-helix domain-containing protein [Chryseolinea serpens]SHG75862.1 Helix-hairpin-helix motif-containing protein [Chryseolinea serpens]
MKRLLAVAWVACATIGFTQEYPRQEIDVNQLIDEWYGIPELDLNYSDLYENLVQLLAHPLNLNAATEEQLRFLKILSPEQIKSLLTYRAENKDFVSVYELQSVPLLDTETLHRLAPLVYVPDPTTLLDARFLSRIKTQSDSYLLLRSGRSLQNAREYNTTTDSSARFKGSPENVYMRFRCTVPGEFSVGFTAEKDAGEALRRDPAAQYYGFDYFSFHAQLQHKGRIQNLVVGDYQSQFGQGLMLGGIFGMGKGGETITTVRRTNIGLLPYTSVYEAGFMRGAAATVSLTNVLSVTAFYSNTKRDAAVQSSDTTSALAEDAETIFISSFQTTGLHRTQKELAARHQVSDRSWGGVLQYKVGALDAGLLFNRVDFGASVTPRVTPYNPFAFKGSQNQNVGGYLNYTFQNMTFFSEYARSINGGAAYAAGTLWSLSGKLDLSLLFRKFAPNFYAFYSNAFAEGSTTQNEEGLYWGWKYKVNRRWTFAGYMDLFRFPWLRFRAYAPTEGHEGLLRIVYQPSRTVMIFAEAREEAKARNETSASNNLYHLLEATKHLYRVNLEYGINQALHLKTRAQLSTLDFRGKQTQGFLLLQDVTLKTGPLEWTGRYALFDTDDYDNRQYTYEKDVWLACSMPAYYGRGVRKVLLIEYKMNKAISVWLRYGQTRYVGREEITSSSGTIAGALQNDVKIQVRISF